MGLRAGLSGSVAARCISPVAAVLLMLSALSAQAAVYVVGSCAGATHGSFEAAYVAAGTTNGPHTIRLCSGTHLTAPQSANWGHDGLTIESLSGRASDTRLESTGASVFTTAWQSFTLRNITAVGSFTGDSSAQIWIEGSTVDGSLQSGSGNITAANSTIPGNVTSGGHIVLDSVAVGGSVTSSSNSLTSTASTIAGDVTAKANLTFTASSVGGTAQSTSNKITATDTTFAADVTAIGDITLTGGVVNGLVRSTSNKVITSGTQLSTGATAHSGMSITGGIISGNFTLTSNNPASFSDTTMLNGSISGASTITFGNSRIGTQTPISATANAGEITVTNGSTVYGNLSAPDDSSVRVTSGSFVYGTCSPIKTDQGYCGAASCSPFLGQATINEVHQIGQNNWIEVKIFDSSTDYSDWTLKSCAGSGNNTECGIYALAGIGVQNDHYLVAKVDKKHIDVHQSKSMSATLFDGSGKEIDFLNVNNFGVSTPNCPFVFDTAISTTSSNLKGVARLPDGDGQWEELSSPGSTDPGTIGDSNTPGATIDHIRIEHDGQGLTCERERVTIKGCVDADCSSYAAGDLTLTLTPTGQWYASASGGTTVSTVALPESGWVTLYLQQPSPVPVSVNASLSGGSAPVTCNDNATLAPCMIAFSDAELRFTEGKPGSEATIANQVAGKPFPGSYHLQAVKSEDGVCAAALTTTRPVTLSYSCLDPRTCSPGEYMKIDGGAPFASSGAVVNLEFDSDGFSKTALSFNYLDTGEIKLNASTTSDTGSSLAGSSNDFVVKPYGFKMGDFTCATGDAPSSGLGAFCVAGGVFTGTVEAVRYDPSAQHNLGATTPSFGHEKSPQAVTLEPAALIAPTIEAGGSLDPFMSSATGSFSGTPNRAIATMVWPNVGTIRIKPKMDYLNAGSLTGEGISDSIAFAGDVGRFYPHHFTLLSGGISPGCGSGGFTYMDQPSLGVTYAIEARNKTDKETTNYFAAPAGGYEHLATVGVVAENADSGTDLGSRISGLGASTWTAGKYDLDVENATFSRSPSPDDLFDDLVIGVKVIGGMDNVPLAGTNMNAGTSGECETAPVPSCDAVQVGSTTKIRFGRLRLANVYGYYSPLSMPVEAQYWSGKSWVLNQDDNCTVIEDENLAADQSGWNLTAPGTLAAGRGAIALTLEPGAARSARICVDLGGDPACTATTSAGLPWLQGKWPPGAGHDNAPWATATFGIFRQESRKGIYNREIY